MKNRLLSRLPTRGEVYPVFSTLVFLVYSWALYRLAWYLPSWMEYLSIPSLLIITAYTLSFAMFESLVMTGLLVLFSLLFPRGVFAGRFATLGSLLALAAGGGAFLLQRQVSMIYRWEIWQVFAYSAAALVGLALAALAGAWLLQRFERLQRLATAVAERMTIFPLLYLPLSLLSLAVVLFRNLFE
ncbi:MAG: hypothetical protein ACKOC5_14235 [Chloroflexota bacterium]